MNWYYVWDPELRAELGVGEDDIAWLCEECAEELGDGVSFASSDGFYGSPCWRCHLPDDEALTFDEADNPDDRPW